MLTEKGKSLYFVTHHPGAPRIFEVNKRLGTDLRIGSPFVSPDGHLVEWCAVPCGQCEACRLARSRIWSERCMIEASQYQHNCFVTLTYGRVCPLEPKKSEFSEFMKRLRLRLGPNVRFFACGEYGEANGRPHFHAILFNCDFKDRRLVKVSDGLSYYQSQLLSEVWPMGMHMITDVTPETCAYVARYCMKKTPAKESWINMSRRPGIGCQWFQDHLDDILPTWKVYVPGAQGATTPCAYFVKLCDNYGVDTTIPKARNQRNAEMASDRDQAMLHLPSEESYRDFKREEFKKKAKRLRLRRAL